MLGQVLIIAGAVAAIISAVLYFMSYKKGSAKLKNWARIAYYGTFGAVILVSVYLLSSIIGHNYQLAYILDYSSNELPFHLLVSSFYSGQEGSFLLWALFVAATGFFVKRSTEKDGYEELVMGIFSLFLFMIMVMLIVKNPFTYIWDKHPDMFKFNEHPINGRGLNPILQNYWMAIHPPLLFIGYALMTVPFAFAIAGLIKKDFNNWILVSRFWTLLATAFLGVGIMLGGFWAYETLGWGGFWGWDPVENSSLLPWLVAVALIHTLLVQRRTGGLIRTNFSLSILGFILVLYATFLTRSGILSDSSVHSFGDPGGLVYSILAFILAFFTLGSYILLFIRNKHIDSSKMDFKVNSKEFGLSIGSIILMAMTVIIFIGTSWPIISGLFGKAKSSVDISFYNEWNLPLAILILVTNAIAVFLAWKQGSYAFAFKKAMISLIAAAVATVMLNAFGVNELKYVLLGFTAFFSLFVNLELIIRKVITDPSKTGAYLSHFGVSLLMLGVLASAGYSSTKHLSLKLGESTEVFGYKVTYTGKTQIEKELKDREKYQFHLKIEKNGSSDIISSIIYLSDFNQRSAPFFEPGVKSYFTTDIYIAPKSIDISQAGNTIGLTKGSVTAMPFDTSKQIMLAGFDMASHQDEAKAKGGVTLGAIISYGDIIDTLYVQMDMQNNIKIPTWKKIQGYDYEAGFMDFVINQEAMGQSQVVIAFKKDGEPVKEPVESYTFEISTKPFINLVWFGTIALAAGFFIAMSRKKKALAVIKEEVKTESDEKSEE